MALMGWAKFHAPSITSVGGKVKVEAHTNLPQTGQLDGNDDKTEHPKYKAAQGWFKVLSLEFDAMASCEVSAGVSVGNVNESCVKFLKHTGENTCFAFEALYRRSIFDVEIVLTGRHGQKQNEEQINYRLRGAVFRKVRTMTGDIKKGIHSTSTSYVNDDTSELDEYEIVFQAADIKTYGKEGKVAVHSGGV